MTDTETLLRGRLRDLDKRADSRDGYAYSEFLTLAEQETVPAVAPVSDWHLCAVFVREPDAGGAHGRGREPRRGSLCRFGGAAAITREVVASARLDALVAAVFHLSRSDAQEYFTRELVAVNGKSVTSFTGEPAIGAIFSVRGKGRFRYEGISGETRKGRLCAQVRVWGKK